MFVSPPTFAGLEAYVSGYVVHAHRYGGPDLDGWYEWLVARRGRECNHGWGGVVLHLALPNGWDSRNLSPDEDRHVVKVFFELLDEFLAEQEATPSHPG